MERLGICAEDVSRWKSQKRNDILAELGAQSGWREAGPCPFAKRTAGTRVNCAIYDTRPLVCRDYPAAVSHMKYVDCEMLEPGDTDQTVIDFMRNSSEAA